MTGLLSRGPEGLWCVGWLSLIDPPVKTRGDRRRTGEKRDNGRRSDRPPATRVLGGGRVARLLNPPRDRGSGVLALPSRSTKVRRKPPRLRDDQECGATATSVSRAA